MREIPVSLPGAGARRQGAQAINHKEFLALWKMGRCSWRLVLASALLQSAAGGMTAALLFSIRSLIQGDMGATGSGYVLCILGAGGLLVGRELLLFATEAIGVKHGVAVFESLR